MVNNGVVDVQASSVWTQTSLTHNAGALLQGSGAFVLPLSYTFDGDINPGTPGTVGALAITGNLVLGASSTITFDATNVLAPAWDQLNISGSLTRAGTLAFNNVGISMGFQLDIINMTGGDTGAFVSTSGWVVTPAPSGGTIFATVP